jgi:hypothetical protein
LRIFFIAATSIWRMPLGADAVLCGQLVQRHAARTVVVDLQPTLLDDAPAARIERVPAPA